MSRKEGIKKITFMLQANIILFGLQLSGQNLLILTDFGNSLFVPTVITQTTIPSTKSNYPSIGSHDYQIYQTSTRDDFFLTSPFLTILNNYSNFKPFMRILICHNHQCRMLSQFVQSETTYRMCPIIFLLGKLHFKLYSLG